MKIKSGKNIGHTQRPRRMARPGLNKHLNNRLANFTRLKFQFFYFFLVKNMRHYFVAILKIIAKATINPAIANSKLAIGQNLARPFETKTNFFSKSFIKLSTFWSKTSGSSAFISLGIL